MAAESGLLAVDTGTPVPSQALAVRGSAGCIPISTLSSIDGQDNWSATYEDGNSCLQVAVNVIRTRAGRTDASTRMLEREAAVWNSLRHDNILPFLGYCEFGLHDYALISPRSKTRDLKTILRSDPTERDPLRILLDVAVAVEYLHHADLVIHGDVRPVIHEDVRPVIHGDLHPGNILILENGRAILADFGLSTTIYRHADFLPKGKNLPFTAPELLEDTCDDKTQRVAKKPGGDSGNRLIRSMNAIRFAAPELLVDDPDPRGAVETKESDIYALGMIVLTVLTGQGPWPGWSDYHVVWKVMQGETPPRPASEIFDDPLWEICLKCWDAVPLRRPTAGDVKEFLTDIFMRRMEVWRSGDDKSHTSLPSLEETGENPHEPDDNAWQSRLFEKINSKGLEPFNDQHQRVGSTGDGSYVYTRPDGGLQGSDEPESKSTIYRWIGRLWEILGAASGSMVEKWGAPAGQAQDAALWVQEAPRFRSSTVELCSAADTEPNIAPNPSFAGRGNPMGRPIHGEGSDGTPSETNLGDHHATVLAALFPGGGEPGGGGRGVEADRAHPDPKETEGTPPVTNKRDHQATIPEAPFPHGGGPSGGGSSANPREPVAAESNGSAPMNPSGRKGNKGSASMIDITPA